VSAAEDQARAALERRYLRLLRCYPPSHREAHREEMLGVLLDAARPGQRAPGLTQAVNLAACGLAIRARRLLIPGPWQDALAVVSLITPALMLISSVLDVGTTVRETVMQDHSYPPGIPFWNMGLVPTLVGPVVLVASWLTVVVLGLAGRRRACLMIAILAAGSGLPALFDLVSPYFLVPGPAYSLLSALPVAVTLAVPFVRRIAGGRVTALIATGFLLDLDPFAGTVLSDVALLLGTLLLTLLVWPVAIASWNERARPA
jgi:hypothetical protein